MNYEHAFHAGNFADLVKHAALTRMVRSLVEIPGPLRVVDTHAGAGLYDLTDPRQARSKEAEAGVKRLLSADLPPEFSNLRQALAELNPEGGVRRYPGSPALVGRALRPGDVHVVCELRPDQFERLRKSAPSADVRLADGYQEAVREAGRPERLFVLIDPPFERADDYVRVADTVRDVTRAKPSAVILVWAPLKDLETLDAFVRRLEAIPAPRALVVETRLRPLSNPLKMNGCVLVAINDPPGFEQQARIIAEFVARALGEPGAGAKVWRTS